MNAPDFPLVVVVPRHSLRRERSMSTEIQALVSSFVIVSLMCYGVYLGITTGKAATTPTRATKTGVVKQSMEGDQPITPRGSGKERTPVQQVTHVKPVTSGRKNGTASSADRRVSSAADRADALVLESLKAARQGLFTKANDLAQEARRLCPNHPAATGAWYIAAYAEQYTGLADEALSRLNGAHDDIDLGPKYGRSAFVERNGDAYTFRTKGGHKSFTATQLNNMDGVRFRIARQFLDNGDMPANDLILAAIHHLKNIDESGSYSRYNPERSLVAAQARCRGAADRGGEVSGHARHLLDLFAWLQACTASRDDGHGTLVDAPAPRSNSVAAR